MEAAKSRYIEVKSHNDISVFSGVKWSRPKVVISRLKGVIRNV